MEIRSRHSSRASTTVVALGLLLAAASTQVSARAAEMAIPLAEQPAPHAQMLVSRTLARHHELAHVVLHVTPPGHADVDNQIIGSSIGRIGKRADDDDLRILRSGTTESVLAKTGDRYNVALPLLDVRGRRIGILALGFRYASGDDLQRMQGRAVAIRNQLQREIPSARYLYASYPATLNHDPTP